MTRDDELTKDYENEGLFPEALGSAPSTEQDLKRNSKFQRIKEFCEDNGLTDPDNYLNDQDKIEL